MDWIKIIHSYSKAHVISKFKNLKHKVQKCNANIRLNKPYLSMNKITNYVDGDIHIIITSDLRMNGAIPLIPL
jgi:hypothetical protein